MTDNPRSRTEADGRARIGRVRDRGMTLPEVLISVVITGLIATSLAVASSVVLRTTDNTEGRLDNSRSEGSVAIWMPSDLASAESVKTDPLAKPCDTQPDDTNSYQGCPSDLADVLANSASSMLLTWHGSTVVSNNAVDTITLVSYRYMQQNGEWVLVRVACDAVEGAPNTGVYGAWACDVSTVLHDLPAPPVGLTWNPPFSTANPAPTPSWVIRVTTALAVDSTVAEGDICDPDDPDPDAACADPGYNSKDAKRILVTIDGGGDAAGDGGGEKTFSFTAGGTDRETSLNTDDLSGAPTFTAARTRCGGNFGLIVDKSSSIGADFTNVRAGLVNFVDTFAGKPVKLQVVAFNQRSQTLGGGWTKYYDMLSEADVADLKSKINALNMAIYTNWEEGWYRMLRNEDGTVRTIIPDKVIFFTDGLPNTSRLQNSSPGTATAVANPADGGLSAPTGGNEFYQVGWNRTQRLIDETGVTDVIGVYVGSDTGASSRWEKSGAGYLYVYERGSGVEYQQGFNATYSRGNALAYERGYQAGNLRSQDGMTYERGYHATYERASTGVTYQQQTTIYQRRNDGGMKFQEKVTGNWTDRGLASSAPAWSTFIAGNTNNTNNDNWRAVVTSTSGATWTNITQSEYNETNVSGGASDGFQTTTGWNNVAWDAYKAGNTSPGASDGWQAVVSSPGTWVAITSTEFSQSDTGDGSGNDGFRSSNAYSAPYSAWEPSDWNTFKTSNTVNTESDGWRARVTGALGNWTSMTAGEYAAANTTATNTDGFHDKLYSAPYSAWEASDLATYNASNTVAGESDGWRARATGASTSWSSITQSEYDKSNTTTDDTDGWRYQLTGGGTSIWQTTTQALYEAGNTNTGSSDGWRTAVTSSNTSWTAVTKAQYDASNTSASHTDESDGWRRRETYPATGPYDGYLNHTYSDPVNNKVILEELVAPQGATYAVYDDAAQSYGDVREVNMFAETNWSRFDDAIRDVALGECGGTVTIQTRRDSVTGPAVADTFTYSNAELQTVETSAAYKSGTFDVVLPGGTASTIAITQQNLSTLGAWRHVSWTCTSQGATLGSPGMTLGTPEVDGGWRELSLNVAANKSISCIQVVTPR